jgi:hypothetical protein
MKCRFTLQFFNGFTRDVPAAEVASRSIYDSEKSPYTAEMLAIRIHTIEKIVEELTGLRLHILAEEVPE